MSISTMGTGHINCLRYLHLELHSLVLVILLLYIVTSHVQLLSWQFLSHKHLFLLSSFLPTTTCFTCILFIGLDCGHHIF